MKRTNKTVTVTMTPTQVADACAAWVNANVMKTSEVSIQPILTNPPTFFVSSFPQFEGIAVYVNPLEETKK